MAMGNQGNAESARAQPKAKVSPVRNVVGIVLLVVFGGTAIVEFMAYRNHSTAVSTMQGMLPKAKQGLNVEDPYTDVPGRPPKDQVEKAIGLSAPAKLKDEGAERSATYNWRGLVRTHKLKAFYTRVDPPRLIRVETE